LQIRKEKRGTREIFFKKIKEKKIKEEKINKFILFYSFPPFILSFSF